MRIAIVLLIFMACISYGKIMTANLGGKCLPSSKVSDGYTVCHAINIKYNLDKGRISTTGAVEDSNVVFMVRFWDADSMRIDFVAWDLHVNMAYADSEYIVPKQVIKDTKYIEIKVYENDDEFNPYKETYKCFDADDDGRDVVPWIVSDMPWDSPHSVKCLPRDTTYTPCKATVKDDDTSFIRCITNAKFAKLLDEIIKDIVPADESQEQSQELPRVLPRSVPPDIPPDMYDTDGTDDESDEADDYTPDGGWYSDQTDCPPSWQDSDGNCKKGW